MQVAVALDPKESHVAILLQGLRIMQVAVALQHLKWMASLFPLPKEKEVLFSSAALPCTAALTCLHHPQPYLPA